MFFLKKIQILGLEIISWRFEVEWVVNWAFTTQTENFCFAQILRERACDGKNAICEAPFSPKTKMSKNRKHRSHSNGYV
jgi:hypothetical protein